MQDSATEQPLVTVYLTVAVRTSQGPGPGVKRLPPGEAAALTAGGLVEQLVKGTVGYGDEYLSDYQAGAS